MTEPYALEPDVSLRLLGPHDAALMSAAISLKRLADAFAPTEGLSFDEKLEGAISRGIGVGVDYAIGVWLRAR